MRTFVRAATLTGYAGLARKLGLDPARLMSEVGLDPAHLTVPDRWISAASVSRLLETSAAVSGREDFSLRLAGLRRLSTLGPLSVVLREEPDLRSALELLMRHERSINEALRIRLVEREDVVTVTLWLEFGEPAPVQQALALAAAALHGVVRECLGGDWQALSVCFSQPRPADLRLFHRLFGPRLQFDHEFTGLVLYSSDLDAPNVLADPQMRAYAQQFLESVVSSRATTTTEQVRELAELLLPLGRCSVDNVARTLNLDRRTLQRRLATESETFSGIVHRTRAGLAERYLTSGRSMTEVSQLLGFEAPSAFSRWFHQQFGSSPSVWRDRAATSPGGMRLS
jgi:AraC-like DNA-binding protein